MILSQNILTRILHSLPVAALLSLSDFVLGEAGVVLDFSGYRSFQLKKSRAGRQNPPFGPLRPDVTILSSGLAGLTPPNSGGRRQILPARFCANKIGDNYVRMQNLGFMCRTKDIGLTDFSQAHQVQKKFVQEVINGGTDILLLTEHLPVLTLGSMATESNILLSKERIKAQHIEIARVDRGGEVTFHGPGQLIVYPIFNLNKFGRNLKLYLSKLEQVAIDLLRYFGIVANSIDGRRGVFVESKKIASIGIGVRKWVSYHGMAINVSTDLRYFSNIKPCGLEVEMTSMERILGKSLSMDRVKKQALNCFCDVFGLKIIEE